MVMLMPLINALRQMRRSISSIIGLVVIVGVAVGFYATLKTNSDNFDESSHRYFQEYAIPDVIIDGVDFTQNDADKLADIAGVKSVQRRAALDTRDGDKTLRLLSYDFQDPRVNIPYIHQGEAPRNSDECLVAHKYAVRHNVQPGDVLSFEHRLFQATCKVSGIATAPEEMYLKQSPTESVADVSLFGVVYVDTEFLESHQVPFQQIALLYQTRNENDAIISSVEQLLGEKILNITEYPDINTVNAFTADVRDFDQMAYIFPIVFLCIASIVVLVGQRRNVLRDRRQIGILKAMGTSSVQIIFLYCAVAVVATIVGVLLGIGIAQVAGPNLVHTYQKIFTAPFFVFEGSLHHIWLPAVLALVISVVSTLIATYSVVRIMPAEAMHAAAPKSGKDIILQRTPIWARLSFHSRYAVKSAFRNWGRSLAMICGVIASTSLTVMSLGFQDSYQLITTEYFDVTAKYDYAITVPPTSINNDPGFSEDINLETQYKALTVPATLRVADRREELPLIITDRPADIYNFQDADDNPMTYGAGIVLPEFYAERLGIGKGDLVTIESSNSVVDGDISVTGLSQQNIGFIAIASYNAAEKDLGLKEQTFTTVFASAKDNIGETKKKLEREESVLAVSAIPNERESFQKHAAALNMYITLLVLFSIMLGIAALYSISSISLLARQYEFVVLRVLGYTPLDISLAYLKELVLQILVGLPLGLVSGLYLTRYVSSKFSNSQLYFEEMIQPDTYVYAALIACLVLAVVWLFSIGMVSRLRLVEGLKARDE